MRPNGPAIKLVNVTRRKHRSESWFFSRKIVPVQGGYGACFCCQAENLFEYYECRGTMLNVRRVLVPGYSKWLRVLVQCRGTRPNRRRLLSLVTDVSTGRGGSPGLSHSQLLSNVQRINANPDSYRDVTSLLILLSVLVLVILHLSRVVFLILFQLSF